MKTNALIIGGIVLALSFTACQNNQKTTENDHSSMNMNTDSNDMNMNTDATGSDLMGAMDKMMKDMHQMQMTGNVDNDFAMMMKSHHQGAVDMAQAELASGADNTLKQIAQKIVDAQKSEIDELQSFLDNHKNPERTYDPAQKDEGFGKLMGQNMTMMMAMPKMDQNSSTDERFVQMMIPHHESAIQMAEGFVQLGKDPKLLAMANKMVADQTKEMEQFKNWSK